MSPEPRFSKYRNLLDSLPDEFKEDITLIQRTISGRDDYKHPTFDETETVIRARVQMIDAANRITEEGGVRETRQARVFLKYDDVPSPPINPIDHVKIRDQRFAIIDEPLLTHLQYELLVQEVIPDGN